MLVAEITGRRECLSSASGCLFIIKSDRVLPSKARVAQLSTATQMWSTKEAQTQPLLLFEMRLAFEVQMYNAAIHSPWDLTVANLSCELLARTVNSLYTVNSRCPLAYIPGDINA